MADEISRRYHESGGNSPDICCGLINKSSALCFQKDKLGRLQPLWGLYSGFKDAMEQHASRWFGKPQMVTWVPGHRTTRTGEFAALLLESRWGWCAQTDGHEGQSGEVQHPVVDVLSVTDVWQDSPPSWDSLAKAKGCAGVAGKLAAHVINAAVMSVFSCYMSTCQLRRHLLCNNPELQVAAIVFF